MLPPDLCIRLQECERRLPSMGITLQSHVGKSHAEAFAELCVVLAEEVIRLNKYVEQYINSCAVHPLQHGPMHHYDGGTVVIVEGEAKPIASSA